MVAKKAKPKTKPAARRAAAPTTRQTPMSNVLRELRIADDLAGGKGLLDLSARLRMYLAPAIKALEALEKAPTTDASPGIQGWLAGRWYDGNGPRHWAPIGKMLHPTCEAANDEGWDECTRLYGTSRTIARDTFKGWYEAKFIKVVE